MSHAFESWSLHSSNFHRVVQKIRAIAERDPNRDSAVLRREASTLMLALSTEYGPYFVTLAGGSHSLSFSFSPFISLFVHPIYCPSSLPSILSASRPLTSSSPRASYAQSTSSHYVSFRGLSLLSLRLTSRVLACLTTSSSFSLFAKFHPCRTFHVLPLPHRMQTSVVAVFFFFIIASFLRNWSYLPSGNLCALSIILLLASISPALFHALPDAQASEPAPPTRKARSRQSRSHIIREAFIVRYFYFLLC
ncbi:hypothetical protein C8J57DRAFT_1512806 [Mycena rebaudengoi]|nr:hypothetical protein C8J57DRAFT_1512806 [Mycena rebaudengoi]